MSGESYNWLGKQRKAKALADQKTLEKGLGTPRKQSRKQFIIEYRYTEEVHALHMKDRDFWSRLYSHNNWIRHGKYKTERDMLTAYEALRDKAYGPLGKYYEYRIKPLGE